MADVLERARAAFAERSWAESVRLLRESPDLAAEDHERLAVAAYLTGDDASSRQAWEEAHRACVEGGDAGRASRCAFWLGLHLMLLGEQSPALGWLARAQRRADEAGPDCPTHGLLLVPQFLQVLGSGDESGAVALADRMLATGQRCADADVTAFGLLCLGEAQLASGRPDQGARLFDEVMIAVTTREVSPVATGIIYCAVIEACVRACDVRRAADWTAALDEWCASQPDLVPYRGQCLVHRSQVLLAHGAWQAALAEVEQARNRLAEPPHPALGLAWYQRGEVARLQGDTATAEDAYGQAHRHGFDPGPGLMLLLLSDGRTADAARLVERLLAETGPTLDRLPVLAAAVEAFLTAGDREAARRAASELVESAAVYPTPAVTAMAGEAAGALALAEGDPAGALAPLRAAARLRRELGMPYELARVQVQLGLACDALGDGTGAALEFAAARAAFERLGAHPELRRLDALPGATRTADPAPDPGGVLTSRELQVLRLVAAGKTNRGIAGTLGISEHTVARHLQNVFLKFDLPSRAAATAFAYEHRLL